MNIDFPGASENVSYRTIHARLVPAFSSPPRVPHRAPPCVPRRTSSSAPSAAGWREAPLPLPPFAHSGRQLTQLVPMRARCCRSRLVGSTGAAGGAAWAGLGETNSSPCGRGKPRQLTPCSTTGASHSCCRCRRCRCHHRLHRCLCDSLTERYSKKVYFIMISL